MASSKNPGGLLTNKFRGLFDRIPPKVKAALGWTKTTQWNPTDKNPDATSSTVVESTTETNQTNEVNKTTFTLGGSSAGFTGNQISPDLQVGVVIEEFDDLGNLGLNPSATTISGSIEDLGGGKGFLQQVDTPAVLTLPEFTAEQRELLPDLFFVGLIEETTAETFEGDAIMPTLAGELRISDQQLDAFKHRISTTARDAVIDGTTFTGKEHISEFGGGIVDNVQSKQASSALSVDFRTVKAESTPIGHGKYFVQYQKLPSGDWPVLIKTEWDDFAGDFFQTATQVVAVGSVTSQLLAGVLTREQQIDDIHTLKIVESYPNLTVPFNQEIPVVVDIAIPDWFTTEPTPVNAVSGYAADRGADYATSSKHGKFPGTLTRKFTETIPTAPAGTYLNFVVNSLTSAEDYSVGGTDQYAKILYYQIPNHIAAEPTGTFIVGLQAQVHKHLWVLEVLTVDL